MSKPEINTKNVSGRRAVKFNSVEDVLRDADALVAAERAGGLDAIGNWTLGQAMNHVAAWINFAFDGFPPNLRPPWFVKMVMRFLKGRYIRGLPAGVRIPKVPGGTMATEVVSTEVGYSALKRAFERLAQIAPTQPSPLFGPMPHSEWIEFNLRHAELHLSFFKPRS